MEWFLVLVFLLIGILWSRIYFSRRHGLGWGVDIGAAFIGMAWPVTLFTHRNPDLCDHRDCMIERESRRANFEAEESILDRARRNEGR